MLIVLEKNNLMSFNILCITFGRSNSTLLGYEFLNTDEFVIEKKL